jgi:hypothetical protein
VEHTLSYGQNLGAERVLITTRGLRINHRENLLTSGHSSASPRGWLFARPRSAARRATSNFSHCVNYARDDLGMAREKHITRAGTPSARVLPRNGRDLA